jgi:hypothetical protein
MLTGLESERPEFNEGHRAFQHGKTIDQNPYVFGSDKYEAWEQGWQEALTADVMG